MANSGQHPRRQKISPLHPTVQAQLTSSIAITSLNGVVVELVKNALDAGAWKVHVELDYRRGRCAVEDDGCGIGGGEFDAREEETDRERGRLGRMFCTSKQPQGDDQEPEELYGRYGRFLACLAGVALVSITSRAEGNEGGYESNAVLYRSRVESRFRTHRADGQDILRYQHGTKVTVRDLFGQLPVRAKHRATWFESREHVEREVDELKRSLVALLLAWARPLTVAVAYGETRRKWALRVPEDKSSDATPRGRIGQPGQAYFELGWTNSLLAQAGYIDRFSVDSWTTASAHTPELWVRAAISLDPAPTKQVQFISWGILPIHLVQSGRGLVDEINHLFALSSFGAFEHGDNTSREERTRRCHDARSKGDKQTGRQLRATAKGADRWPMFVIRIEIKKEQTLIGAATSADVPHENHLTWRKIADLLKAMFSRFLEEHHQHPKGPRKRRRPEAGKSVASVATSSDDAESQYCDVSLPSADICGPRTVSKGRNGIFNTQAGRQGACNAFDRWSRVKSGRHNATDGLLSGLPRSKACMTAFRSASAPPPAQSRNRLIELGREAVGNPEAQTMMGRDVEILLEDLQSEAPSFAEAQTPRGIGGIRDITVQARNASSDQQSSNPIPENGDSYIAWTNPKTGRVVHLNSRTGFAISRTMDDQRSHEECVQDTQHTVEASSSRPDAPMAALRTRSTAEQVLALRAGSKSWIGNLLRDSEDHVFRRIEEPIPRLTLEETKPGPWTSRLDAGGCTCEPGTGSVKWMHAPFNARSSRLSKHALADARVLAQVDQKFILVRMSRVCDNDEDEQRDSDEAPNDSILVLIDQHAADERCRVEALYEELCGAKSVLLPKSVQFEVPQREAVHFERKRSYLARWGFGYEISPILPRPRSCPAPAALTDGRRSRTAELPRRIVVKAVPELVSERCRLDPQILIHTLRSAIWSEREREGEERGEGERERERERRNGKDKGREKEEREEREENEGISSASRELVGTSDGQRWLSAVASCPRRVVEMLNSRACRSAIMFNDPLSLDECQALVQRLSRCVFPFQCAHGRPSMVVLGQLAPATRPWPPTAADPDDSGDPFDRQFERWVAEGSTDP